MSRLVRFDYDATDVPTSVLERDKEPRYAKPWPLPSEREMLRRRALLAGDKEALARLRELWPLSEWAVKEYGLGLWQRPSGMYIGIPVRDRVGFLENVRLRRLGGEDGVRYRNWPGRGEVKLFGAHRLPDPGSELVVCAGEADAMILWQSGISAVSGTGGVSNWPSGWDGLGSVWEVTVVFDRGEEEYARAVGRRVGARRVVELSSHLGPIGTDLADVFRQGGDSGVRRAVGR